MNPREEPVEIDGELRIVTERSIWLIRPAAYMRMPRTEERRPPPDSDALVDNTWHRHEGVWHAQDATGAWLRILPTGRRPGSVGITTGLVAAVSPANALTNARARS